MGGPELESVNNVVPVAIKYKMIKKSWGYDRMMEEQTQK